MPKVDHIRLYLQCARNYFEDLAKQQETIFLSVSQKISTASHTLGCFLISQGYEKVCYAAGERTVSEQYQTHAWLEWNGWIIDITADQFADGPSAVFMERGSEFHRSFTRDYESEPEISSCIAAQNQKFLRYMES
ncbi:hypothetical protein HGG82_04400 [Marinomonas sp. M1K-6]|uniref:Microcin J25-processing protein McjB C-terminal domain-containing protein n=1 Tax=Marinomonas profundi TaxID=2726122 RepID=A0A847R073_9GAMM|nr:hypothetical protein [Marinomonas profundi]NLQ16861.1 hypothetical protein [Marinomonas profundi]UDV02592.1 hypothetical protein J8N69_13490 [Marinomonas profundi]